MSNETLKVVIGTTSGLIVGGLIGFAVTQNVLRTKFEQLLDEEVDKVKKYYKNLSEESGSEFLDKTTEEELLLEAKYSAEEIIGEEGYSEDTEEDFEYVEESTVTSETHETKDGKVYTVQSVEYDRKGRKIPGHTNGDIIDYNSPEFKKMVSNRSPDKPYIITVDEFMDDNPEFEKQCITYFKEDDTLCDERDQIIPDIDSVVGYSNLEHFGLYSKDDSLVFIRNERISSDFEVAFDDRSYVEAIAGFKMRKMNRIKWEDD